MDGKQLRNSILQWAIQGKLVPQDPNDEPASVLLERIREEKSRLVKEKKIKCDKNESIIYRGDDNSYYEKFLTTGEVKCIDDEISFDLPESWCWCRIRHIFSMQAGKNIKAVELFDKDKEHPYPCYGGNGIRGYMNRYNNEGTFPIVGRQGALCGNINMACGQFYATEHAVVTDTLGITNPYWAQWFLMALNLNQYATATAQPGLAVSNIIEVLIPLPPFNEQQRIVDKLNLSISLVDKYDDVNCRLYMLNNNIQHQLKKSILQQAIQGKLVSQNVSDEPASVLLERIKAEKERLIKEKKIKRDKQDSIIYRDDDNKYYENLNGDESDITDQIPFDLPLSWQWVRLEALCSILTGASFKKEEATTQGENKIRILRGGNILPFKLLLKGDDIFIDESIVNENILLRENDLVTPAVTSLENICKMARVEQNYDKITMGGFVFIIRGYKSDRILAHYLQCVFSSPTTIEFVRSITNKSGQAFYNIGKERLSNTLIPIPPYDEMERITSQIDVIFQSLN